MHPIKLNENIKANIITQITAQLNNLRLDSTKINFKADLKELIQSNTHNRPKVIISPIAYLRMLIYTLDTTTEIAWHGTVERDKENNTYYIKDVFLYPQTIAAATVQTDQEEYNKWIQELPDDILNNMRLQGHSHVNFAVTPSGTDLAYYNDMLQCLPENDYYIFLIINKQRALTMLIYDLATNTVYDTKDIDITLAGDTDLTTKQIENEKKIYLKTPVLNTNYGYNGYNSYGNYTHKPSTFDLDDEDWYPKKTIEHVIPTNKTNTTKIKKKR